jgi:hypothetical protein
MRIVIAVLLLVGSALGQSGHPKGDDGSKVVKLTNSEYSNLQKLRNAVEDEERMLASKYGAVLYPGNIMCFSAEGESCDRPVLPVDHFEFHGQFLIIEKGKP